MIRISTNQIYDAGVGTINAQTAGLLHLQQQVALGRRILTPADDPVAAARALEVTQASDITAQFSTNHNNVKSALGLEEAQLTSINDLLGRLKELTVQAGNDTLSASDRKGIAVELRGRFEELVGIANSTDGAGQYIFSGFSGATKPFAGSVDSLIQNPASDISYLGDDGQRQLQVSSNRFLAISDSGNDVFRRIPNGNGTFVTGYAAANTGGASIDAGSVSNVTAWNANTNKNLDVRFYVDSTQTPAVTYYDLVDTTAGLSLLTGGGPVVPTFPGVPAGLRVFSENQAIVLQNQGAEPAFDYGASLVVGGAPASGDVFTVAPSSSQSLFRTLANLIGTLEAGQTGTGSRAKFSNNIGFALTNFDQANDNILKVRAAIGSRLSEVDSLSSVNSDLQLQYQQTLSNLQDLDYAKAITDLQRKQNDLEAAQKSFVSSSQLSLFNYI